MATSYQAWIEDHAYYYEREQAALAATAVARDIAELREEWALHLRVYGATEAQTAEIVADFAALEALGFGSADVEAFDNAYVALDEKIHALTCAAFGNQR